MTSTDVPVASMGSGVPTEEPLRVEEVRVVSAVVVDEEAISAGVRAAQYNMLDELRAVI